MRHEINKSDIKIAMSLDIQVASDIDSIKGYRKRLTYNPESRDFHFTYEDDKTRISDRTSCIDEAVDLYNNI